MMKSRFQFVFEEYNCLGRPMKEYAFSHGYFVRGTNDGLLTQEEAMCVASAESRKSKHNDKTV